MIEGKRAIAQFGAQRTHQVVVTTMSSSREWPIVSNRLDLDLAIRGCMGKASSVGLGIALARPDRQVIVLDGDGSLLMNLGTLVTIAGAAPRNLVHVIFEGRSYDTSGGQPTPGEGRADLAALARAAGYRTAASIDDEATLERELPGLLAAAGPTFIRVEVNTMWATNPMPGRGTGRNARAVAEALAAEPAPA
ncbi:MAG: thiamine pyrophosphate-binding protein [Chloroflexi bacterium]|nr:thiamine pyrophosphate-binding protein [Chloroflexota bacterium]